MSYVHGRVSTYLKYKCRCDKCSEANSKYYANYRQRTQNTLTSDDMRHGTYYGYSHFKCRCDKCSEANSNYRKELRRRNKKQQNRTRITITE